MPRNGDKMHPGPQNKEAAYAFFFFLKRKEAAKLRTWRGIFTSRAVEPSAQTGAKSLAPFGQCLPLTASRFEH